MKKITAILLAALLSFTLCACSSGVKLTVSEVEEQLKDGLGTLNMETSGDNVESFTYVIDSIDPDVLADKSQMRNLVMTLLSGNGNELSYKEFHTTGICHAVFGIKLLLSDENGNAEEGLESALEIACDGVVGKYGKWNVSVSVDEVNETATIHVTS